MYINCLNKNIWLPIESFSEPNFMLKLPSLYLYRHLIRIIKDYTRLGVHG